MRAVLVKTIEAQGYAFPTVIPMGTIGTLEQTEVSGWDYEFYPNGGSCGICVSNDEIIVVVEEEQSPTAH